MDILFIGLEFESGQDHDSALASVVFIIIMRVVIPSVEITEVLSKGQNL